ncbi:hypothetical protein [Vulgatibacter sp.]|uniref:hypothetical protein n=1 Tax=Vulgatibacter sp. TaxID=1971226 RepID=UPI003563A7FB
MRELMMMVVAVVATVGLIACGGDSDDGKGGGTGSLDSNPCFKDMQSEACMACAMAASECYDAGICADEWDANETCGASCDDANDPDCCMQETKAVAACMRAECDDGAPCYYGI